jgi:sugar phosphate isomerase/epimerase
MIRPDIVATCWTIAGTARPGDPSEASPIPATERVSAAAAAGCTGLGLVLADLEIVRDTIGFDALREHARSEGIAHLEVELVTDWWLDPDAAWHRDAELLFEAASVLGSPFVKIGPPPGEALPSLEPLVAPLRRLADEADRAGTRLALEPLPFAGIESLPRGAELIRAAGHGGVGLIVDYWHVFRAGTSLPELAASLEPAMVLGVEIDDADAHPEPGRSLFEDTRDNRRYPGEGDQDVVGFVRTMSDLGFEGPWGVEILSREHRELSLDEGLARAVRRTRECLEAAEDPRLAPVREKLPDLGTDPHVPFVPRRPGGPLTD